MPQFIDLHIHRIITMLLLDNYSNLYLLRPKIQVQIFWIRASAAASSSRRADSTAAKGELLQFATRRALGWLLDRPVFVVVRCLESDFT